MDHQQNSLIEKWKQQAKKLKGETYTLMLAYKDPRTPWHAKVMAGLVVAYAFSPIDLIPDFIPILGYLDDLILVPLGVRWAIKMIPPAVMADCRARAQAEVEKGKPVNWIVAVLIVLIWAAVAAFCLKWIAGILRGSGNP